MSSYAIDGVNEWVATAVEHRKPVSEEEDDVDVAVPETKFMSKRKLLFERL